MTKIEYVTSNDKTFWYSLDKHLPEKEFENKVASKQGYVIFADDRPVMRLWALNHSAKEL